MDPAMEMPVKEEASAEMVERPMELLRIDQSFDQCLCVADGVVSRMMLEKDRRAALDFWMGQEPFESVELTIADRPGGDEGKASDGARQTHDGDRTTQSNEGKGAALTRSSAVERKITRHVGAEPRAEALRSHGATRVRIVIAWDEAHVIGVEPEAAEEIVDAIELTLEREIGDVAGDHDVVDPTRADFFGGSEHGLGFVMMTSLEP